MAEIKVNFAALATAQADITTTVARVNSRLEDLRRFLAPMVATWEGDAAVAYQAHQRTWDTSAAELAAVLQQVGVAVGNSNQEFQVMETRLAGGWSPGGGGAGRP